jgi:hypothetical protein
MVRLIELPKLAYISYLKYSDTIICTITLAIF